MPLLGDCHLACGFNEMVPPLQKADGIQTNVIVARRDDVGDDPGHQREQA